MTRLGLQTVAHKGTLLVGGDMHFKLRLLACIIIFSLQNKAKPHDSLS